MTKKNITLLSFLFGVLLLPFGNLYAQGMHPEKQIEKVNELLKSKDPRTVKAYEQLIREADRALGESHHALADFSVPGRYVNAEKHKENSQSIQIDAFNAYACALAFRLGGGEKYGCKACELLNAWASINRKYSEFDGPLVMAYSGAGLLNAALLMKNQPLWSRSDQARFADWVTQVYKKSGDEIRNRKNNWADWGRYASLLSASYLGNRDEILRNAELIKSDLHKKIAPDGSMPEEVVRGENGIWYTYFSLAPITASAWIVYNETGEDLFNRTFQSSDLKTALNYLLRYSRAPQDWPHFANPNKPASMNGLGGWPANLFEAMAGVYGESSFAEYATPMRPIFYPRHHFAWTFPTLMPCALGDGKAPNQRYEKLYVWLTPENPYKKTPVIRVDTATVLRTISREHPRLFATAATLTALRRQLPNDSLLQRYVREVLAECDKMAQQELPKATRQRTNWLFHLGFAYQWTNDRKYADKGVKLLLELSREAGSWDWVHFLGAAEGVLAAGVGYDQFYHALNEDERREVRDAIIKNGLLPGIGAFEGAPYGWFRYVRHNWNLVCNSGLIVGALAIAKDDENSNFYARYLIPRAVESMALALNEYAPDGAYPEGPGYWGFATSHTILGLEALSSAMRTDYGLSQFEGFNRTFYYNWYMTAPNGNVVSYADSSPDGKNRPNGLLFWMANRFDDPRLANREHTLLAEQKRKAHVYDLLFYAPPASAPLAPLPLDAYFRGPVEVASLRTSWNSDALFATIKAGYNQVNHGHLDVGAFELFASGEKWFYDLGSDNYYLPDFFDMNGGRWNHFRTRSESHNVPMINEENQNIYGVSKVERVEINQPLSQVTVDLTDLYKGAVNEMRRTLQMDKLKQKVTLTDEYRLIAPAEISWRGLTDAQIRLSKSNREAVLIQKGKQLKVKILSPDRCTFVVQSAQQAPPQKENKGVSILKAVSPAQKGNVKLVIEIY